MIGAVSAEGGFSHMYVINDSKCGKPGRGHCHLLESSRSLDEPQQGACKAVHEASGRLGLGPR
jgi:hypothetical protein